MKSNFTVVRCELLSAQADCILEVWDSELASVSLWRVPGRERCVLEIFPESTDKVLSVLAALRMVGKLTEIAVDPVVERRPTEDWAENWKRFFKVERVTERIIIRPSWEEYHPGAGEHVITLDPGLSFGTGQHATTRACLGFLDRLGREDADRSVLDMGCGTGILAIAAGLLGFRRVRGFDNDPKAVRVARENARINGVRTEILLADLTHAHPPSDIVVANILAPTLIEFAGEIAGSLLKSSGARLIISGILETQYSAVLQAYETHGLRESESVVGGEYGEWRSALLQWR